MMADLTGPAKNGFISRRPRKSRTGVVESNKADKTITIVCNRLVKHPKYGKYINRRTVLHAHDAKNEADIGDRVEVAQCRPISKNKSWRLVRILERA